VIRSTRGRGWGYALDYAKAIAEDRAQLALWDGPLMRGVSAQLTQEERGWIEGARKYHLVQWVMTYPSARIARAALADVPLEEFECAALVLDLQLPDLAAQPEPARWYPRGEVLLKRFEAYEDLRTEEQRKKLVKKLKTDLARHLRNQAKWGKGGGA
jgi:hypothetical protein